MGGKAPPGFGGGAGYHTQNKRRLRKQPPYNHGVPKGI